MVKGKGPFSIVMAPTRELALQIAAVLVEAGSKCGMGCICIYGGVGKKEQVWGGGGKRACCLHSEALMAPILLRRNAALMTACGSCPPAAGGRAAEGRGDCGGDTRAAGGPAQRGFLRAEREIDD